ncbi:hypothetical protein STEG23_000482 [Scotinomys teguina]
MLFGISLSTSPPFMQSDAYTEHGHIIIKCNKGSTIVFHSVLGYLCSMVLGSYTTAYLSKKLPDTFSEAKFITLSKLVFFIVCVSFLPVYHSTKGKLMVAMEIYSFLASGAAPWFAVSGRLTVSSWEKLGRDLDFAAEQGMLKSGVRPIWKLISYLEDQRCSETVETGQVALEMLQEERSEKANSAKGKENKGLYPDLSGLENSESTESTDSEELHSLIEQTEQTRIRKGKKGKGKGRECTPPACYTTPSAPPLYGSGGSGHLFNHEVWRTVRTELQLACPVFQDAQGQRNHEPLDFKVIKSLTESVKTYGITASFTVAQVEALSRHCMTPNDWSGLVRVCLSPGQYLDWRAFLIEFASEEAAANQAAGNAAWDRDMLLGQGRFAILQTGYPVQVYEQINKIGMKAWKALPNKGEVSGNLTKIVQGPMGPFSDFVACMVEPASRIFGDPDTAMPLIKQLI